MNIPWPYVLPLCAALTYVIAALFIKRAAELGAGVWRTAFVCNVIAALCFQPLALLGGQAQPLTRWWQPALVALLFVAGQIFTFVSLSRGDVSVATPVLGLKIILVAAFTTALLAQPLSLRLWLAAALATTGVALLNRSGAAHQGKAGQGKAGHKVGHTVATAALAAASFALFDVLVQKWSPAWGLGRLLPASIGLVGLYSCALVPLFEAPLRTLPRPAWRPLLAGGSLMSLQSVLIVSTIAQFGDATSANVIYSSRGLWSIAAVRLVGHWFHNRENQQGALVLRWRFAGAALMFVAILLVLT